MQRPLGCLTGTALITAALVTLLVLVAAAATGNGIFSPGPLNGQVRNGTIGGVASHAELTIGGVTSHAALEGRCSACHAAPLSGERQADLCLRCHTAVGQEIASGGGLHGRFAAAPDCRVCHTDHGGATASLTRANPTEFAHEVTGFSLAAHAVRGWGARFVCADCHTASLLTFSVQTCLTCHQKLDPVRMAPHLETFGATCLACHDGIDTYGAKFDHHRFPLTGGHVQAPCAACHPGATDLAALRAAPTACVACHAARDIHGGRLGTSCSECHTPATWTDGTIDHNRTSFPLVGAHVGTICLKCHVDRQWTGIATTCRACHAAVDPHQGQFKDDCAACHAATGWKDVTFDHAQTTFKLEGGHAKPACAACHPGGRYVGTPTTCIACHQKDDTHAGTLGTDCAACHQATVWSESTFDHSKSAFPLAGAHTSTACAACHPGGRYKGTPTTCIACHQKDDKHIGTLGTDCAACHQVTAWADVTFDHARTSFPLAGAHTSTACAACHPGGRYKGTPTTCIACHQKDDRHTGTLGTDCAACHKVTAWADVTFNHARTSFPLAGAHASTACVACHPGGRFKGTPTTCIACHAKNDKHNGSFGTNCAACHKVTTWADVTFNHAKTSFPLTGAHTSTACVACHLGGQFKGTPTTCISCHRGDDKHNGSFGTNCAACHKTTTWADWTFDHSKSSFPLTGAHRSATCAACHKGGVFKGTSTTCSACHARPASHDSNFNGVCSACHTTSAWQPASYNGPHPFPQNHGGAGGVCSRCHPSSWTSYSCASCHSTSSMASKHRDVSGYSPTQCARCHPTGRGGD